MENSSFETTTTAWSETVIKICDTVAPKSDIYIV